MYRSSRDTWSALLAVLALAISSDPLAGAVIDRIGSFSAGDPTACRDAAPDLAIKPGGSFLLIWQQTGCPTPPTSVVRALRFDAAGRKLGAAIDLWSGRDPKIAPLPGGGFVAVSEKEPNLESSFTGIGLHRLDDLGRPVGEAIVVAVDRFSPNVAPEISVAPNGAVAVVWQVVSVNPLFPAIVRGRFYDSALHPTSDAFLLSNGPTFPGQFEPAVAFRGDGTALALWTGTFTTPAPQVFGRVFDGSGHPLTDDFPVSQIVVLGNVAPSAVASPSGGWWVSWQSLPLPYPPPPGPDRGDTDARVAHVGPHGERLGLEHLFNPLSLPSGPLALGTGASGDLLVLFPAPDGSISGRRIVSDRELSSDLFDLSETASVPYLEPAIGDRSAGAFVAAWSGASPVSEDDTDLFGTIVAPACLPETTAACLGPEARYGVEVAWQLGAQSGTAKPLPLAGNSATFGLRHPADHDLTVLLSGPDSRDLTFAATTGAALEIRVTDKSTGAVQTFTKPAGRFASRKISNALPDLGGTGDLMAEHSVAIHERPESSEAILPTEGQTCLPTSRALCLLGGRFRAELLAGPNPRPALSLARTDKSGAFAFPSGPETPLVTLTMIDGRANNGKFWVYLGGLSAAGYRVQITDLSTGVVKTYANPPGKLESRADRAAF